MPHLTVVIGGNGAGKTTWTRHRENRATLRGPFYNADTLAEGLGDWNDPKRQREARKIVDENIAALSRATHRLPNRRCASFRDGFR